MAFRRAAHVSAGPTRVRFARGQCFQGPPVFGVRITDGATVPLARCGVPQGSQLSCCCYRQESQGCSILRGCDPASKGPLTGQGGPKRLLGWPKRAPNRSQIAPRRPRLPPASTRSLQDASRSLPRRSQEDKLIEVPLVVSDFSVFAISAFPCSKTAKEAPMVGPRHPRGPRQGPNTAQKGPKAASDVAKAAQEASTTAEETPKTAPKEGPRRPPEALEKPPRTQARWRVGPKASRYPWAPLCRAHSPPLGSLSLDERAPRPTSKSRRPERCGAYCVVEAQGQNAPH